MGEVQRLNLIVFAPRLRAVYTHAAHTPLHASRIYIYIFAHPGTPLRVVFRENHLQQAAALWRARALPPFVRSSLNLLTRSPPRPILSPTSYKHVHVYVYIHTYIPNLLYTCKRIISKTAKAYRGAPAIPSLTRTKSHRSGTADVPLVRGVYAEES